LAIDGLNLYIREKLVNQYLVDLDQMSENVQ